MTPMRHRLRLLLALISGTVLPSLCATEIQWTRTTAQFPVEASPLVGPFGKGGTNILILNMGGQLLLWDANGTPLGSGQDGMVAQLPAGRWTTQPTALGAGTDLRLVIANVKGDLVCLDQSFRQKWQHKLAGETVWGRAFPTILKTPLGENLVFSDSSGLLTCLTPDGKLTWTNALQSGPCKAPPKTISLPNGQNLLLAPASSNLICCEISGKVKWKRNLSSDVITRPEELAVGSKRLLLCGTANGDLYALDLSGKVLWKAPIGEPFSGWLTILSRPDKAPLILFTSLWGNLHAVDARGNRAWTHLFRSKTRGAPLAVNANGDNHPHIFVPAFNQHVYAFDDEGQLVDDIRLSGILPSALVPIDSPSGRPDLLATSTTLLAYRLRPGPAKSPYGETPAARDLSLQVHDRRDPKSVLIKNPAGSLLNVELSAQTKQGCSKIVGTVTTRSLFELPLDKAFSSNDTKTIRVKVHDNSGKILLEKKWSPPPIISRPSAKPTFNGLIARLAPPYESFDEKNYSRFLNDLPNSPPQLSLQNLYLDEIDETAFVLASSLDEPVRARITIPRLTRADGTTFSGGTALHDVVFVGSVNGEEVPDALTDGGLLSLNPRRLTKLWISVDAHNAQSGVYTGRVVVAPLHTNVSKLEIPFKVEVLDLRLPTQPPLSLCTWDYVPNRWFSNRVSEVLDDMSRHGVNIFPRTTIPPGRVDADGKLTIDWNPLDAELQRLQGRGKILFQLGHPPVEFPASQTAEKKYTSELEYIHEFRDHLKQYGRDYSDYAIYLLDEPGLDYGTNVAVLLDIGKLIRKADPKIQTYTDPVPGLSWKDLERIEPLVDIWAPNMRLVSGLLSGDPRIKRIMKAQTVWSYECVAQVKSLSPLRYNRANAWRAKYFGLSGIGFWTHSTTEADHWLPGKGENDEFALVYPGELPVPSVRWEAARDGLEDIAAISLLQEQIALNKNAGSKSELVREAEAEIKIALRDVMELSDEAFVESRDFLRKGDRVLPHTAADVEIFRHHRAEFARLTLALRSGR